MVKDISFAQTLLTVLGTVLGFVISYRVSVCDVAFCHAK